MAVLLGARASRVENQDAIDACIVGMLGDPKEVPTLFAGLDILVHNYNNYYDQSVITGYPLLCLVRYFINSLLVFPG